MQVLPQAPDWYLHPAGRCTPRPISWPWQSRFPLGKLVLLEGDPGLGKSLITLDLCARLTTGRPMPDGNPGQPACNVLVLNGEDSDEDTILPRLQVLQAASERVFLLKFRGSAQTRLLLPLHLQVLADAVHQCCARLVVIDPISAFLDPAIYCNSDQSIRRVLWQLAQLADQRQATILLVRHLNKQAGRQALYRGAGSIGLIGACRSAWLVAREPILSLPGEGPAGGARCILAQLKNNLAGPQLSLAYQFRQEGNGPPALDWQGPSPWTADQLVAVSRAGASNLGPGDRARELLHEYLSDGPRPARAVWDWACNEGISQMTLKRAKERLKIRSEVLCEGKRRHWYWLLPDQMLPCCSPENPTAEIDTWLKQLRERFPTSTPLDEPL